MSSSSQAGSMDLSASSSRPAVASSLPASQPAACRSSSCLFLRRSRSHDHGQPAARSVEVRGGVACVWCAGLCAGLWSVTDVVIIPHSTRMERASSSS